MKKHMTIAALLAAGAAFSDAAVETELLWGLDFTSDTLELSTGSGTSVSGVGTISTTDGAVDGAGSYSTGGCLFSRVLRFTASGDTSALNKQTGAFTLSFHAKWDGASNNQWPVLASFGENNGWCAKVNFSGDSAGNQNIGSSGSYGFAPDGYNFSENTRGDVTLDNSWHHFVVTFQGGSESATLTLYVDGASTATTTWTGAGLDNDSPMTAFSFGGRLCANTESDLAPNTANMSFSDIAVYKGVLESDQIAYLGSNKANDSAIPEPSAFGLLAGLGALALVASRRRRK